jgi:carbonic anhydrase/acetyltransferase-like protein (isoleucine patch superfamily)
MHAYVVRSHIRISPFGDEARDLTVGNVPLGLWQKRLFEKRGLTVKEVDRIEDVPAGEDRIITYDNVFFTRRVLKSFLERWGERRTPARVALPLDSTFIRSFSTLQDFAATDRHAMFNLWALPSGGSIDAAAPLEVLYKERVVEYRMPEHLTGVAVWPHPITSSVCLHIRHWIHVLQANRLAVQVFWVDRLIEHPIWAAMVVLRGLMPGRGRLLWRIARRANVIGKGVDIHPTARVEASFLGDGVRVGPQALVRASIIGKGSALEERVNVSYSVVGERSFVSKNSVVYASASMEGADLGMSGMQMCLAGKRCALTPRATPTDVVPGGKIKVRMNGAFEEIDLPLLGSCFGHDTYVGADLYIAPGREIPNGVRIGPQPERVLSSIPDDLEAGRFYTVRDGRLTER